MIMPGLPAPRRRVGFGMYHSHQQADITPPVLPTTSSKTANMASHINFIASQMDPLAGSSTRATRQSPLRLLIQDAGVLVTMLPYLPYVFLPLRANGPSSELYMDFRGARDMILQGWLFVMETSLLILVPLAFLLLPGVVSIMAMALCCLTVYLVSWPMQGPNVTYSNMDEMTEAMAERHKNERWLFLNGCATG